MPGFLFKGITMSELDIIWPAIIKYDDDDELGYVVDQQQWNQATGLHQFQFDGSDVLIDSSGQVYSLTMIENSVSINTTGEIKNLKEILGLVKAHAAQAGSCCVAKLYAPSIYEAFKIVKSTLND